MDIALVFKVFDLSCFVLRIDCIIIVDKVVLSGKCK